MLTQVLSHLLGGTVGISIAMSGYAAFMYFREEKGNRDPTAKKIAVGFVLLGICAFAGLYFLLR